jgi:hypothetical protein
MWEVMHACVIIKSECGDPAARDDPMYHNEGPLATVDHHLPTEFLLIS